MDADRPGLEELPDSAVLWRVVSYLESVRADPEFIGPVKRAARMRARLEQQAAEANVAGQHEVGKGF